MLGRFTAVVGCMLAVSMRHVGGMTCLLVISTLVMLGGFSMMVCCVLVMFCCLLVTLRAFVLHVGDLCVNLPGHCKSPGSLNMVVLPVSSRFRSGKFHITAAGNAQLTRWFFSWLA